MQPYAILVFFLQDFYHDSCFVWLIVLQITSAVLYQVRYQASLLQQKSHSYGVGYVMQPWKCSSLQITNYGKKCFAIIA